MLVEEFLDTEWKVADMNIDGKRIKLSNATETKSIWIPVGDIMAALCKLHFQGWGDDIPEYLEEWQIDE